MAAVATGGHLRQPNPYTSRYRFINALVRAHELPDDRWRAVTRGQALNLPGLTVTVAQMIESLRRAGGAEAAARVRFAPDARIKAIVQSWPARFDTARATALGFDADANFDDVVAAHVAAQTTEGPRP